MLELLEQIALTEYDQPHEISSIVADRSPIQDRLLEQHDEHVRSHTGTRILCSPQFEESKSNRLLQATDLCAFAADLHARPYAVEKTRRAKPADGSPAQHTLGSDWYPRFLNRHFPHCIGGGGIRKLSGGDAK